MLTTLGVVVAATAVVASPWYIRQTIHYGNPVFDRPTENKPVWERRPASFYFGLGLPKVFTAPIRPNYVNKALPTTYSDLWGDYFGVWRGSRALQSILGLLPTLLAVVGWAVLLARSRGAPARLPAALLPGLRNFKLDASTDALLLESDKDLRAFRQMTMRYKTRDFLFIAVVPKQDLFTPDSLEMLSRLRDDLSQVPAVKDIITVLVLVILPAATPHPPTANK